MGKPKTTKVGKKHASCSENWKALEKEISDNKIKNKQKETIESSPENSKEIHRKRKLLVLDKETNAKKTKKTHVSISNDTPPNSKSNTGVMKTELKNKTTNSSPKHKKGGNNKNINGKNGKSLGSGKDVDIWFDDIPIEDIMEADTDSANMLNIVSKKASRMETSHTAKKLVKSNAFGGLTKAVAMDCEMVGVGESGRESVLARVSLVNLFGKCIYDKFVKSREEVTDYRTFVSGVRPVDLENAEEFEVVQKEVSDILQGRILVGHALWNDMKVLFLDHPKKCVRDTARYKPFKTMVGGKSPALRVLCSKILGVQVQKGEHSSVQDAQAAMRLYTMFKKQWEAEAPKTFLSKNQKKKFNADEKIKSMQGRT